MAPSWYLALKAAIFALLTWNTAFYLRAGTLSETVDSAAWLVLLALFELETGMGARLRTARAAAAIRYTRLAAAAAIVVAAGRYVSEDAWLDAINTGLWVAVVALLELEVRFPQVGARGHRRWFTAAALALYASLAMLVLVWAWRGSWFDAYDALLWLIAFAMIEMDVLGISRRQIADLRAPGLSATDRDRRRA